MAESKSRGSLRGVGLDMKKLISFILLLTVAMNLCACSNKTNGTVTLPENIDKLTIALNSGPALTFSYTDGEKIRVIAEYLSSLDLTPTKEDPSEYTGGGWEITVTSGTNTIDLFHYGNLFFKTADGKWWAISYEQAEKFTTLLKENVPDELPKNKVFDEWEQ